jgi:hypothetical protein
VPRAARIEGASVDRSEFSGHGVARRPWRDTPCELPGYDPTYPPATAEQHTPAGPFIRKGQTTDGSSRPAPVRGSPARDSQFGSRATLQFMAKETLFYEMETVLRSAGHQRWPL